MVDLYKLDDVIEHLESVYGFEIVPCGIPKNHFQYIKRNFYLFLYKKVSKKLFYFLRDRISSIKYLQERPSKEIWIKFRSNDRTECEIEINPLPIGSAIYVSDSRGFSIPDIDGDNFSVRIHHSYGNFGHMPFLMNSKNGIKCMDSYLSDFPVFRQKLRDKKLSSILNVHR